jgi:hypothetical protein
VPRVGAARPCDIGGADHFFGQIDANDFTDRTGTFRSRKQHRATTAGNVEYPLTPASSTRCRPKYAKHAGPTASYSGASRSNIDLTCAFRAFASMLTAEPFFPPVQ